eukprot:1457119-Amphidinium_carterae.2
MANLNCAMKTVSLNWVMKRVNLNWRMKKRCEAEEGDVEDVWDGEVVLLEPTSQKTFHWKTTYHVTVVQLSILGDYLHYSISTPYPQAYGDRDPTKLDKVCAMEVTMARVFHVSVAQACDIFECPEKTCFAATVASHP